VMDVRIALGPDDGVERRRRAHRRRRGAALRWRRLARRPRLGSSARSPRSRSPRDHAAIVESAIDARCRAVMRTARAIFEAPGREAARRWWR
jgi:hypothetical protein